MLVEIGFMDVLISVVYLILIYVVAAIAGGNINHPDDKRYYYLGLTVKLFGALFTVWLYAYYYGTGDSLFYFRRSLRITQWIIDHPDDFFKLIVFSPDPQNDYEAYMMYYWNGGDKASNYMPTRFSAFFNFITFNSYVANALLFSALSYVGIWQLYRLFRDETGLPRKQVAIAFLFIPSVFFWGSGLLKDTISFGFMGLLIYTSHKVIIRQILRPLYIVVLILSFLIVGTTKAYILMAIMPALFIWKAFEVRKRVNSAFLKAMVFPIVIILSIGGGVLILQQMASLFQRYSINNLTEQAEKMQRWHTYRVEHELEGEGASYNLGHVEFTPTGIARKIPAAINVALFRPYPWEARNAVVLLAAAESFVLFFFSLRFLLRGPRRTFSAIFSDPILFFCFLFSMIFAFAVGFTAYNFGAQSRYRIPMLPFYVLMLFYLPTVIDRRSQPVHQRSETSSNSEANTGQVAVTE